MLPANLSVYQRKFKFCAKIIGWILLKMSKSLWNGLVSM